MLSSVPPIFYVNILPKLGLLKLNLMKQGGMVHLGTLVMVLLLFSGCKFLPKGTVDAQTTPRSEGATSVDVAIAAIAPLEATRTYIGTTQPLREVVIRAQTEGQLQQLNVDVGDRVQQGQTLAQIDDVLLKAATTEAESELASRQTEVIQQKTQVNDAETQVEQNRLKLQQAQSDASRYNQLARAGAISKQQAEQSNTEAKTAAQIVRSAQEKVRNQQQAVIAAGNRVDAQEAVVTQQRERRSYAVLSAPIDGAVLTRSTEQGNVVQVGNELLRLGDFSRAKVTLQVSELDLANVRLGGAAMVKLDAFANQQFVGEVTQVSRVANSTSRLVPVEVTIPNADGLIGSGLLARVSLTQAKRDRVVVPLSALQGDRTQPNNRAQSPQSTRTNPGVAKPKKTSGTLFVVTGEGEQAKVTQRNVTLGKSIDGKVQILSGLNAGERFVSRMGKPLKDGDPVRLSILSEK